jgi:hypothetical protein
MDHPMRIRTTFSTPHPAIGDSTESHLVISLHGEDTAGTRPKVGIIPVVDRSGSMASSRKLHIVTSALAHLSSYLNGDDRLALISFDDRVETNLPIRAADAEGSSAFTQALLGLRPRGNTNLQAGIEAGLAAAARTSDDTLTRVIVLTDGRANSGGTTFASLAPLLSDRPAHVSVSFLGVGTDCDHTLLGRLAEAGGGAYGFIETAGEAPAVLGAEVGALIGAEAHQVTVRVTTRDKYASLSGDKPLGLPGTRSGNTITTHISQVLTGATRNVVIPVTLHGAGKSHARPVTCADVEVTGLLGGTALEFFGKPKVKFKPDAGAADADVVKLVELAQVSDAVEHARVLADSGRMADARHHINALSLTNAAALNLQVQMANQYADHMPRAEADAVLSSFQALNRGSLVGSSAVFDSLASRTVGTYYTSSQLSVSNQTAAAVTNVTPPSVTINGLPGAGAMSLLNGAQSVQDDIDSTDDDEVTA